MQRNPLNDKDIDGNTLNLSLYERARKSMQRIVEEKLMLTKFSNFEDFLSQVYAEGDGASTLDEYRMHIEKDGALDRRFQKVLIEPPEMS